MKTNTFILSWIMAGTLASCEGVINYSSQTSSRSETNISENSETISNGDNTISRKDRKEKSSSESESNSKIGFSVEDKTGIADEVRRNLKKRRQGDSTDVENDTEDSNNSKPKKQSSPLKGSADCKSALSADDFEDAKGKMQKATMDKDKVSRAKQIFNEVCVSSKQAQEVVSTLRLENYKLDMAKFLYGRVTDKDKFMRVADEFSFDDTKKKLRNYIED
jgi:hypothetical protein